MSTAEVYTTEISSRYLKLKRLAAPSEGPYSILKIRVGLAETAQDQGQTGILAASWDTWWFLKTSWTPLFSQLKAGRVWPVSWVFDAEATYNTGGGLRAVQCYPAARLRTEISS